MVSQEDIKKVRDTFMDAGHPVFNLVPPALNVFINECYGQLGSPAVDRSTVWDVYNNLLALVSTCD